MVLYHHFFNTQLPNSFAVYNGNAWFEFAASSSLNQLEPFVTLMADILIIVGGAYHFVRSTEELSTAHDFPAKGHAQYVPSIATPAWEFGQRPSQLLSLHHMRNLWYWDLSWQAEHGSRVLPQMSQKDGFWWECFFCFFFFSPGLNKQGGNRATEFFLQNGVSAKELASFIRSLSGMGLTSASSTGEAIFKQAAVKAGFVTKGECSVHWNQTPFNFFFSPFFFFDRYYHIHPYPVYTFVHRVWQIHHPSHFYLLFVSPFYGLKAGPMPFWANCKISGVLKLDNFARNTQEDWFTSNLKTSGVYFWGTVTGNAPPHDAEGRPEIQDFGPGVLVPRLC